MSRSISDVIDHLAGIQPGSSLDRLRDQRPQARENAQKSYLALFEPEFPGDVKAIERYAVATFVAGLHRQPHVADFYAACLQGIEHLGLANAIGAEIARGSAEGPYGGYPHGPLTVEDKKGPVYQVSAENRQSLGSRLAAALEHAHLLVFHPRDASSAALQKLLDAGWSTTDIVTLSQLVAFLSFQISVVAGLRALAGASAVETTELSLHRSSRASWRPAPFEKGHSMTETTLSHPDNLEPIAFTQEELGWLPWLEPFPADQLTERHLAGLVDASRAKSPYFLLLARDPDVLQARTKTDKDIFYNTSNGLPRAERELAATATSRHNGCIFCASVHSRFATHYSKRGGDIQRLLDEGVEADIDSRWNAIIEASVTLTDTPIAFTKEQIRALRTAGLDDLEIVDVINGAAFFNWANRLMLALGEPTPPATA